MSISSKAPIEFRESLVSLLSRFHEFCRECRAEALLGVTFSFRGEFLGESPSLSPSSIVASKPGEGGPMVEFAFTVVFWDQEMGSL